MNQLRFLQFASHEAPLVLKKTEDAK